MRSARVTRVTRGGVAATFATFAALLSHVAGGGSVPGWVGVVVPLGLSSIVCIALAGRSPSAVRTTAAVFMSQFFFHTLFVLGAVPGASGSIDPHAAHGAGHSASMLMPESTMGLVAADSQMWIWHGIAAAMTALVLHRSEVRVRAMRALADIIGRWFARLGVLIRAEIVAPTRLRLRLVDLDLLTARQPIFVAVARRRGPPVLSAS